MRRLALTLVLAACAQPAALAADKADAPELAKFTRTEETRDCLRATSIRDVDVLNGHQILFRMRGGETWLNEPKCVGLRKTSALVYRVDVGQICTSTIVRLLEPGTPFGDSGGCSLSPWTKLETKPGN